MPAHAYADVERFCLFMGYTRSGHSLVGTVLDAHPEAVIAHEGKIFVAEEGQSITGRLRPVNRRRLFKYLIERSARQAGEGHRGFRRDQSAPSNLIPGGCHGRYTTLRVIGTKRGQEPPMAWERNPQVFDELARLTKAEVRLIHVYRNPWDNIASMGRYHGDRAIVKYFRRAETIKRFREEGLSRSTTWRSKTSWAIRRRRCEGCSNSSTCPSTRRSSRRAPRGIDGEVSASRREREWTRRGCPAREPAHGEHPLAGALSGAPLRTEGRERG